MAETKAPWCSVTATVEVIGGRWKPTILFHLKDQPRRFNELRRLVPGITQRMLTLQLRALEQDGIVTRTVHQTRAAARRICLHQEGLDAGADPRRDGEHGARRTGRAGGRDSARALD